MAHVQSAQEAELAVLRRKLEQATRQLTERDLEITALKEELASLRQGHSPTVETDESSTMSHVVDNDTGNHW